MSIKSQLRLLARKFGVEINRFNASQSHAARVGVQLASNRVDCILDIGANDGGYADFIRSTGFDSNIISFEPQAIPHAELVKKSISYPNWHIAPRMALGEVESELEINIAGNSTSSSLLEMLPSHIKSAPQSVCIGKEKVAVRRLDSYDDQVIRNSKNIYLKIDTQGYEMPVLLGSVGLLNRVVGIQVEMSLIPLYRGQVLYRELIDWLERAGYVMWGLEPGFQDQLTGRILQFDGIFYKADSADLAGN
jgi:FkbM family methyltransferase